jgi:TRAP transporter TAXI family solute receptor
MRATCFLLALLVAGCGGGPDGDALRKDVAARLAAALPSGEVSLADFDRRGSQADTKAPAGETRRVVYFDAGLKVEKDFDFGAWDGPGVAGLVSTLGAGPKGISGLASGGNKAGDVLRVHGTALYKREGSAWAPVATAGFRPSVAPAYATNEAQGAAAIVEGINKVLASAPRDTAPATRAMIEEELAAAYAAIRARAARSAEGFAIAAGPEHGQYLRFAQALASDKALRTVALITRGGDDNLRLLRDGKVTLALAQADAALDAYQGRGNFATEGPFPALRAVGSLYPEPVHVLVRADSQLPSVGDLKGKRVAIGVHGSASRATALRVLEAHGVVLRDITPLELPINQALVALRQDKADAVIQTIGVPADSIRDALAAIPLRLLPLSDKAVAALAKSKAGYFAYTIPQGVYAAQKEDVRTIATAAVLLVGSNLSESEVATVTFYVYERGRDFAARGSAQGMQVSAGKARQGLSVPQHGAAAKAIDALVKKL